MKFRSIYMLECYDDNFNCVVRLFYRNKRAAERARCQYKRFTISSVTLVPKRDHKFIRPEDVRS